MKKLLYLLAILPLFCSCDSSDDSTLANGTLPFIEIEDFQEGGYNIVSYQGNHLQIAPQITTGYSDSQLSYHWYLVDDQAQEFAYINGKEYSWEEIGKDKNLDYEVNLSPGNYYICLDVTAENGYTVSKQTTLLVSTDFTSGYYILKETSDGNTELDVFRANENRLIEDLFKATTGEALAGSPMTLSMSFDHSYIDENTNRQAGGNLAVVTTKKGLIRCLYTGDLSAVLRNDNILFDEMGSNVQPYLMYSGICSNFLISSDGMRSQYCYSVGGGSGKYGVAGGLGGSRFVLADNDGYMSVIWGESTHSLYYVDYNGGPGYFDNPTNNVNNMIGWECLACGFSKMAKFAVFLLENSSTKERKLIYLKVSFSGVSVNKIVPVASSAHLAKGNVFTVSNSSSTFIYTIDNNRIYGYDLNSGEEQEIGAADVGNETITYISDKYVSRKVDYFVVGTQNGNQYTLRFYNQLGGKPDGAPVYTVKGTGKVASIKFTNTTISGMSGVPAIQD